LNSLKPEFTEGPACFNFISRQDFEIAAKGPLGCSPSFRVPEVDFEVSIMKKLDVSIGPALPADRSHSIHRAVL
jgi:hypothetical protein